MLLRFLPVTDKGIILHHFEKTSEGMLSASSDGIDKVQKSSSQNNRDMVLVTHFLYKVAVSHHP